jgi:hypothetical protein
MRMPERTNSLERVHHQKKQSDDRDHQQGARILADHYSVKHLQHVDRGGQHEQVGNHAEEARHHELKAEVPQRARQLVAIEYVRNFHVLIFLR